MERKFKMLKKGKQITYEGWKEDFIYLFIYSKKRAAIYLEGRHDHKKKKGK